MKLNPFFPPRLDQASGSVLKDPSALECLGVQTESHKLTSTPASISSLKLSTDLKTNFKKSIHDGDAIFEETFEYGKNIFEEDFHGKYDTLEQVFGE